MTRSARLILAATLPAAMLWLLCVPRLSAEEYRFPIANPLKSSLLPAGYPPPRARYAMSFLEIRSDRRKVRFLENRHRLILAVFAQRTPAPLVFVVPGVGGYSLSEPALMLGEQLHDMGFHAVTLPDPLSWQYTLGVSESAVPGYLPLDSREYYELLRRVVAHLQAEQHLAITGYSVVGYSFGGLLTAFLVREDAEQRAFAFARAVLINPAIDLKHAVGVVDGFFDAGHSISDARKDQISRSMVDVVIRLRNRPFTYELAGWARDQWTFGDDEMRWLIGSSFRNATQGTIFAGRQIERARARPPVSGLEPKHVLVSEAKRYSFRDYLSQFVFPSLRRSAAVTSPDDQLLEQASLGALGPELGASPSVYVLENVDDFLARPQDIDSLRAWLGDRLYLYPRGGHVGNLWLDRNKDDLRRIMAPAAQGR
jgi:pimeloyl-ACP methyl ester carboxylesterase